VPREKRAFSGSSTAEGSIKTRVSRNECLFAKKLQTSRSHNIFTFQGGRRLAASRELNLGKREPLSGKEREKPLRVKRVLTDFGEPHAAKKGSWQSDVPLRRLKKALDLEEGLSRPKGGWCI